jgi:hypothetical protein
MDILSHCRRDEKLSEIPIAAEVLLCIMVTIGVSKKRLQVMSTLQGQTSLPETEPIGIHIFRQHS